MKITQVGKNRKKEETRRRRMNSVLRVSLSLWTEPHLMNVWFNTSKWEIIKFWLCCMYEYFNCCSCDDYKIKQSQIYKFWQSLRAQILVFNFLYSPQTWSYAQPQFSINQTYKTMRMNLPTATFKFENKYTGKQW